ncbi:hypothetical protein EMCRGX_G023049 [Ephydatia muelleri]
MYYSKFLPHLASTLSPLYSLLEKQRSWSWGRAQQSALLQAKQLLISADVLTHFDPQKKLLLSCDASPYGVGAVLSHETEDGSDRPIAYASRTLSPAEKKAGKQMGNADALSRLPVEESSTEGAEPIETVLMVEALDNCGSPITMAQSKPDRQGPYFEQSKEYRDPWQLEDPGQ